MFALRRCRVHRIPYPTFVTTAKRPSFGCGMAWVVKVFLPAGETNYFCEWDWTTQIRLNSFGKFRFTLERISGLRAGRAEPVMRLIARRANQWTGGALLSEHARQSVGSVEHLRNPSPCRDTDVGTMTRRCSGYSDAQRIRRTSVVPTVANLACPLFLAAAPTMSKQSCWPATNCAEI
jgi:hypothetical protein